MAGIKVARFNCVAIFLIAIISYPLFFNKRNTQANMFTPNDYDYVSIGFADLRFHATIKKQNPNA